MKKLSYFLILFLPVTIHLYSWRSYAISLPGSADNAVASATVGEAEGLLAMRINPAGLVQIEKKISFSYDVFSSLVIKDPFSGNWKIAFDTFPFLGAVFHAGKLPIGIDLETIFEHNHINHPLQIRALRLSSAFAILPNVSLGLGIAPILGIEGSSWALSWNIRTGILWKIIQEIQFGLTINTPFYMEWTNPIDGASLTENYPLIAEAGLVWQLRRQLRLYAALEYIGVDGIHYMLDGQDASPNLNGDLQNKLHPKIGIRLLDPIFGSLLGFGVMTTSDYYNDGSQTQYLLTAGIQAHADRALITASWVDSYLLRVITPQNTGEEKIHIGITFGLD